MADTTTTLNPGTGGDVMDESLVTQISGTQQAKRPRVVLGNDAGQIVDATDIVTALQLVLRELRAHTVLLQALMGTTACPVSFDEAYEIAASLKAD